MTMADTGATEPSGPEPEAPTDTDAGRSDAAEPQTPEAAAGDSDVTVPAAEPGRDGAVAAGAGTDSEAATAADDVSAACGGDSPAPGPGSDAAAVIGATTNAEGDVVAGDVAVSGAEPGRGGTASGDGLAAESESVVAVAGVAVGETRPDVISGTGTAVAGEVGEAGDRVLDEAEFRAALEAMLLIVDAPASAESLASALDGDRQRVERALREMAAELTARGSGIDLRFVGDGWRYYTRTDYAPYVERMLLDGARSKLTRAALETLAVIAYRQPVTRARVSAVRGVNVDGVIRTLVARGLIAESGADPETNGTLYVTTELFLERIGLASLAELPPLAPLLPGVDLIDEINESLETDPRYTRLRKPAEDDIDLGSED